MSKDNVIWEKDYHGFEASYDISRDMDELWDEIDLPGEFQGKLTITISYKEPCE